MSRNGTMESNISNQYYQHQQQQNLQQLQNLENNVHNYQQSKSFTSSDSRNRAIAEVLNPGSAVPQAEAQSQTQSHQAQQAANYQSAVGRTGSVASAAINSNPNQQKIHHQPSQSRRISTQSAVGGGTDPRTPFAVQVPTKANPTEVLAFRFSAWRSIITSLLQYLTEIVSIQDEVVRQQIRLSHAVSFPAFQDTSKTNQPIQHGEDTIHQNFFLPVGNGSIHDLPNVLINFHSSSANLASKASKELNTNVIPRLDDLRRELLVKIKEIKGLSSDFKNNVAKEVGQTKMDLQHFLKSIEEAKYSAHNVQPKNDPYLTKITLEKQLKRQLVEENYLHEAFINLQSSGKELEKVVVIEVQNALTVYAKLFGEQAQNVFDKLISNLDYGFLTKQPSFEWDQFVAKDKNFIDENLPKRDYKSIQYDKINDPLTFEVRSSFLERRSKFLKSYSRGFYVLTPTFLHEFKTADRKKDLLPVMSLPLDDIELEEHSKRETNQYKFVLKKVGKLSSHKFIFRAESYDLMLNWYNDIKNLKNLSSPTSRGVYASKHHTAKSQLSRVSTNTSRVVRPNSAHGSANDTATILSAPNNNQSLPQTSSTPIPQSMIGPDGVIYKAIGSTTDLTQTPQQIQRQSLPPDSRQQTQTPVQQQRYSLQYAPQGQPQQQLSPYPTTAPFQDNHYPVQVPASTQSNLPVINNQYPQQQQQLSPHPQQFYSLPQEHYLSTPAMYVEAPTPLMNNYANNSPQQTSKFRNSLDSYPQANRAPNEYEADGSGLSEETAKTTKKETHTGEEGFGQMLNQHR
ncbi:Phosphatidylinositol 4,5-bisphosphate effector protein [Wickerhamomyces ciferrii]|uniref:Phosphatidylinositol 4,5-bisphosphate effector protein n=1 Tax=Wickerhamomyces ciferrii (strain ATCC 14091 / BCRC 22168 / CBS 111 / JCM 3599 / NBRC 0793 / NRRL Y-1031 F-60-10) TaxID=1206466 RepID=K0KQW1_WICCF|nr:Phosphatidylinositol 4,5-bisphosphate effector protein [Wickerhamomyces ciferrii]CCH43663.1 Phosphatidylinositol 4,5-bisphosphate effector protein [Wickerhamomyces ciferrii]